MAAAVPGDVGLLEREAFPRGNTELQLHQIDTRNQFGDRMFDLKTCIHLQEVVRPGR